MSDQRSISPGNASLRKKFAALYASANSCSRVWLSLNVRHESLVQFREVCTADARHGARLRRGGLIHRLQFVHAVRASGWTNRPQSQLAETAGGGGHLSVQCRRFDDRMIVPADASCSGVSQGCEGQFLAVSRPSKPVSVVNAEATAAKQLAEIQVPFDDEADARFGCSVFSGGVSFAIFSHVASGNRSL